jgi:leader peptidase (prepilin peptidase)/N-methyltransferase
VFRLPRRCLRVWKPKLSFCPVCNRTIAWYDNLPVASFLLLRGRCRGCLSAIPVRYFLVEVATALFFLYVASTQLMGDERHIVTALGEVAFFALLLVGALVDLDWRVIPAAVTVPGILVGPLVLGWRGVLGAVVGALALWTIRVLLSKIRGREIERPGAVSYLAMIGAFTGVEGVLCALAVAGLSTLPPRSGGRVGVGGALGAGAALFAFVPFVREHVLALETLWRR